MNRPRNVFVSGIARQVIGLINSYKPDVVMDIALAYQNLTIMDMYLACGVNYMDAANYALSRKGLNIL